MTPSLHKAPGAFAELSRAQGAALLQHVPRNGLSMALQSTRVVWEPTQIFKKDFTPMILFEGLQTLVPSQTAGTAAARG